MTAFPVAISSLQPLILNFLCVERSPSWWARSWWWHFLSPSRLHPLTLNLLCAERTPFWWAWSWWRHAVWQLPLRRPTKATKMTHDEVRSGSGFSFLCPVRYGSYHKFYTCWIIIIFFTLIQSSVSLHCFIFLVSVICVKIFNIFYSVSKYFGKGIVYLFIWLKWIWIWIRIRQMIPIRPDPDPDHCPEEIVF